MQSIACEHYKLVQMKKHLHQWMDYTQHVRKRLFCFAVFQTNRVTIICCQLNGIRTQRVGRNKLKEQECIPVGCVPPAAIAVSPATHAPCHACSPATYSPPTMHAPLPCMSPCHACPLPWMPPCDSLPLPHMSPSPLRTESQTPVKT